METKSIVIDIPDGMCIDESKSTFEKIVFKKIDAKPRSWEEYCDNFRGKVYYIKDDDTSNIGTAFSIRGLNNRYKNYTPSKELAEAFLATMQLMSLRQAWIGNWEPDWSKEYLSNYCIIGIHCDFKVCLLNKFRHPLSFPTKEMAEDFMNTFKDLLEIAKPLI